MVLRYKQIVMHAISRDTSTFPRPCIYLQLEDGLEDVMREVNEGDDGVEEEAETRVSGADAEIRFIPEDSQKGEIKSILER